MTTNQPPTSQAPVTGPGSIRHRAPLRTVPTPGHGTTPPAPRGPAPAPAITIEQDEILTLIAHHATRAAELHMADLQGLPAYTAHLARLSTLTGHLGRARR